MDRIFIYDTTLRDGSQGEGISFSLQDKLAITLKLDELGVDYIEGGYPIANPKDESYFKEVKSLKLRHARIASFGSTRRANTRVEDDKNIKALLMAETPVVTIVGKSWDFQVKNVLKVPLDENLKMVGEKGAGRPTIAAQPSYKYVHTCGDHSHKMIMHDSQFFNRLRTGGLILFHDYSPDGSIRPSAGSFRALNELQIKHRPADVRIMGTGQVGTLGWIRREGETWD